MKDTSSVSVSDSLIIKMDGRVLRSIHQKPTIEEPKSIETKENKNNE